MEFLFSIVLFRSVICCLFVLSDCRDHYEYCGQWAKSHYCNVADYRAYMNLVCPFSCGICDGNSFTCNP